MSKLYALKGKDVFDKSKITVVGSPTITSDGVASGLTNSDDLIQYISADNLVDKSWEVMGLVYWDGVSEYTNYFKIGDQYQYLQLRSNKNVIFNGYIKDTNEQIWMATNKPDILTEVGWYYLGLSFNYETGTFTTYLGKSLNNIEVVQTKNIGVGNQLRNLTNQYFVYSAGGSINLPTVKIYINNQLIYTPTKPTYLLERRKPKVWNKGQFTVVGNPSISDDGVVSGLSNNDYIVPTSLTLEQLKGKSWSYSFKCTIPDTSASSKYIISFANNLFPSLVGGIKFEGYGIYLGGKYGTTEDSTAELWKLIGTYSRPADVGKEVLITVSFNIETGEYNAKAILDNKELNMTPYIPPTANKELYYINTNSSSKVFRVLVGNDKFYLKSIKIYTDNNLIFDGGAETYVYDPSKFTVVGSPTITEYGVASGFSSGLNYIKTSTAIDFSKPFEIYSSFKLNDITSSACVLWKILGSDYNNNLVVRPKSNSIDIVFKINKTDVTVSVKVFSFVANLIYKTILGWDGAKYYLKIRAENETNWKESSVLLDLPIDVSSSRQIVTIGKMPSEQNINFTGSIDLPQFLITTDGKEVFTGAKEQFYMLRR